MTKVEAWQHIYANVEKEQSPRNQGGFQTLFYTQSALTEAEVEEMEARLLYFSSSTEPVKRVFFATSTGKIVMAQIVPLSAADRLSRGGRYLAHSLAFAPEAFAHLGGGLFRVFRQFPFITTVEEALERGNLRTGDVSASSLNVLRDPTRELEVVSDWSTRELKKLAALALRANQLASDRSLVAFIGQPQEVERALEAAFLTVPVPLRPNCTFDTHFYRCNPVATYFWGVGLPELPHNPRFVVVDVRSRQVQEEVVSQPETAYERWAVSLLEAKELDTIVNYRDHAFAVCQWLGGRTCDDSLLDQVSSDVILSIFRENARQVRALLHTKLEASLPAVLVDRVFDHFYAQTGVKLFKRLRARFKLPQLLEALYKVYESQGFRTPQREEIQAVAQLLERVDHRSLRLLHVCWTEQHKQLRGELKRLDEDEYRWFVQTAVRYDIVEPSALLIRGRGDTFLDVYLTPGIPKECDLVALVQALLMTGEASCLSRLASYVPKRSEKELRALERIISRRQDTPEVFRQAINDTIAALPPRKGFGGFLNSLLGSQQAEVEKERGD